MQFGPPWTVHLPPKQAVTITAEKCAVRITNACLMGHRGPHVVGRTFVRVKFEDLVDPGRSTINASVCSLVTKLREQAAVDVLIPKGRSMIADTSGDDNWVCLMGHYLIDDISSSVTTTTQPGETVSSTDVTNRKRPRTQSRAKAAASSAATTQDNDGAKTALAQEPTPVATRSSTPVTRRNSARSNATLNVTPVTSAVVPVGAQQLLSAAASPSTKDSHANVPGIERSTAPAPIGAHTLAESNFTFVAQGPDADKQDAVDRPLAAHGKPTAASSTSEDSSATLQDLVEGVAIEDMKMGNRAGPAVASGDTVTIRFRVRVEGAENDYDYNFKGHTFTVGDASVIRGVSIGLHGMHIGGERLILIHPNFAYGSRGNGTSVPPNAIIHYECQLLSIDHQAPKQLGA